MLVTETGGTLLTVAKDVKLQLEAAVAEFGMVLHDSPHKGAASMDSVIVRANGARGSDTHAHRDEFVRFAMVAKELIAGERVSSRQRDSRR